MVIKTASPGVIINEVDLTRGTSDAITTNVGGFVGPFAKGPVDEMVLIETEAELQKTFGDPTTENAEYWYTVSNFLEYGGVCYVIRCDDLSGGSQTMKNAVSNGSAVYIKNYDDFEENFDDGVSLSATFVGRFPGAYGNALATAVIDAGADQQTKVGTTTIKDATDGAAASTTRPSTSTPGGTALTTYEVVQAVAFVAPTPFAAVETAGGTDVTLSGEQAIGGVTTSASRVLLTGQTDVATNGIYVTSANAWTRADDADAAADFQYGKSVVVSGGSAAGTFYYTGSDDPTIDTDNLTFSATNPAPDSLSVFDFVTLGDPASGGAATGYISSIDATNNAYTIAIVSGTFVGAIGTDSHLENAAGDEISGVISNAEALFSSELYDQVTSDQNTLVNVVNTNNTVTKDVGAELYNWPANPTQGLTKSSTAGVVYGYDSTAGKWVAIAGLSAGSVLGFGSEYYQLSSAESWYDQQIAFEGIPWYRFAPRPGTSLNAQSRGAKNDEMNILVYDATGELTGSKGNTLEQYIGVSKLKGAVSPEGEANYYHKVMNEKGSFVYSGALIAPLQATDASPSINTGSSAVGTTIASGVTSVYIQNKSYQLTSGVDQLTASLGERQIAYNKFSTENLSILDYILQGPAGANLVDSTALGNFLINICEERRDCMAFLSPLRSYVVGIADSEKVTSNIVEWANTLTSSSYVVFDSGYKYAYDRFNDRYMYMPLNGDTAGTLVHTSIVAEPYYSPAGVSRGQIRNVVKLTYNPSKAQRDQLYTARVNPVVNFPGEGTVLFGDKTGLAYSSAFDRINVRRLFLVIEKELAIIARVNLFEFNDEVTRTLFKNNANPFLRDIQSKRGMYDYLIVCDDSNNPPGIIDRNEFVADIYIKPARSINFITLSFVATKTGASFEESIGLFRGTTSTTGA